MAASWEIVPPGRPAAFHASCSAMAASISASSISAAESTFPQGCEHAVLAQGDDHGGLVAEMDHIVTVAGLFWPCAHEHDASPGTLPGPVLTRPRTDPLTAPTRIGMSSSAGKLSSGRVTDAHCTSIRVRRSPPGER